MNDPAGIAEFDGIVVGTSTIAFLSSRRMLPTSWGLPAAEKERILLARIRITALYSPASVLMASPNPFKNLDGFALVMFDATGFETANLTREEIIATLLHEIGHVVNQPRRKAPTSTTESAAAYAETMKRKQCHADELEADDYARHCGYGMHVASGLEKFAANNRHFANELTRTRVERIKGEQAKVLHFV